MCACVYMCACCVCVRVYVCVYVCVYMQGSGFYAWLPVVVGFRSKNFPCTAVVYLAV